MRITREDEFSEFSDKHNGILKVFPYRNETKIWSALVAELFFLLLDQGAVGEVH